CAAAFAIDPAQLGEQARDRIAAAEAGRMHTRAAVQTVDFDAGVLADQPRVGLERAAEERLRARVLVVGLAFRGRIRVGAEELDLPPRERGAQLSELPLVGRAELRYRLQTTPCTKSRSASRTTSRSDALSSVSVTMRRSR